MKIAAIGDLHCKIDSGGLVKQLVAGVEDRADMLVLAGDLTNRGLAEEMQVLVEDLQALSLPIVAVMGNHDHESNQIQLLVNMLRGSGVCVLENDVCEIRGIGFIGTKGFCGGFGAHRVQPFGEKAIKDFVQAGVDAVLEMEKAMATLDTTEKIGVVHYAPIKQTLEGETPELYPFLGSSLLEQAFDREEVAVIFHGHAHNGSPLGHTQGNIPVYNVSRFVADRLGNRPYVVFDLVKQGKSQSA